MGNINVLHRYHGCGLIPWLCAPRLPAPIGDALVDALRTCVCVSVSLCVCLCVSTCMLALTRVLVFIARPGATQHWFASPMTSSLTVRMLVQWMVWPPVLTAVLCERCSELHELVSGRGPLVL